jgi:hypothetical protein
MFGHADQLQPNPAGQPMPDNALGADNQPLGTPAVDLDSLTSSAMSATIAPTIPAAPAVQPEAPVFADTPAVTPSLGADTDQLLDIKQQALQQLTPLVGHLQQEPEEKFRTTMMMIQASDNDGLIKTAYEAAQQITDEKVRAQALLDIVNEINYFTHNKAAQA